MKKSAGANMVAITGVLFISSTADAQVASSDQGREVGLVDIVVTAQKRAERLQDVPVAVTAVDAQALGSFGALNTDDLSVAAPALNNQRFGTFSLPALRGITTTNTAVGAEANVASYVDGVYRPAIFSQLADFNSIERVEVLKGPQGTLFGRNATGGAVNVITRSPTLSETTGDFSASYGRFNEVVGTGYLNVPLGSKAAFNVAVAGLHRDGYIRNVFLNKNVGTVNNIAVRAKLLLEPDDRTRITITGEYADQHDLVGSQSYAIQGNLAAKAVAAGLGQTAIFGDRYRTTGVGQENSQSVKTYGASVLAEVNLGAVDLISLSNVLYSGITSNLDIDQASTQYLGLDYGPKSLSGGEDLRFQSSGNGPFTWSVGVNYFFSKDYVSPQIVYVIPANLVFNTRAQSRTSAVAVYGQASYEIVPNLTLTAGARMNFEGKNAYFGGAGTGVPITRMRKNWKNFSPRVAIDYKLTPKTMVYASYSQGWKSGLFNPSSNTSVPANPETINAFELGVKSDITNWLRVNVSGFYYNYKDIQVSAFGSDVLSTFIQNAASARLYGVDADVTGVFDNILQDRDSLKFTGGGVWTHARYRSFPGAVAFNPIVDPVLGFVGNTATAVSADGNDLPLAPHLTLSGNLTYEFETGSGIWNANVNAYYNSGWYSDSANTEAFRQNAYAKVGVNLGWSSPDRTYDISLWVRNLNNAKTHAIVTPNVNGSFTTSMLPRTFGIKAGFHF